jgi:membrane fusion protein, copper/silver efflux system
MRKKQNNSQNVLIVQTKNTFVLLAIIAVSIVFGACRQEHTETHDRYTCPMHPTVVSDRPGSCPVCGMDLVRKARAGEEVKITGELAKLLKSPNQQIVSNAKTTKGTYSKEGLNIATQGIVTYDTRNFFSIPSRVAGRIEKLYIKSVFQKVTEGQKIVDIYSPELVSAQRELLFVVANDPSNKSLVDGASEKLKLLGFQQNDIEKLIRDKKLMMTVAIYSSYSGYVVTGEADAPVAPVTSKSTQTTMGKMSSSASTTSTDESSIMEKSALIIREGEYISAGQIVVNLVNSQSLWVELKLPSSSSVKKGDRVMLQFQNGTTMKTVVDFVQPFYSAGEDFSTVRVNISGERGLRIGEVINATIELSGVEGLWIPTKSLLDLGLDQIVFVKEKDMFKPRKIKVGTKSNSKIQVLEGLSSSDEIAEDASYLVDSESFVNYEQ